MAKKWYVIKGPQEKKWAAYEIEAEWLKQLKDGVEVKGPFKSATAALLGAMLAADKDAEVARS